MRSRSHIASFASLMPAKKKKKAYASRSGKRKAGTLSSFQSLKAKLKTEQRSREQVEKKRKQLERELAESQKRILELEKTVADERKKNDDFWAEARRRGAELEELQPNLHASMVAHWDAR